MRESFQKKVSHTPVQYSVRSPEGRNLTQFPRPFLPDPSLATNADAYPIQPLAGHLEMTPRTGTNAGIGAPPPSTQYPAHVTNASVTTVIASGSTPQRPVATSSQQPGGSNPYRFEQEYNPSLDELDPAVHYITECARENNVERLVSFYHIAMT